MMGQVTVKNALLNDIIWQKDTDCQFTITDNVVDVWRVDIGLHHPYIADLKKLLNEDEVARADRYIREKDKTRFIVSRAALKQIISKYIQQPPESINFIIGFNKKPQIASSPLKYNVSHSGNWALIAISNTNLGVDTEKFDLNFNYRSILDGNFTADEITFIGRSPQNFYLSWTRKEALTKATGQGLDENLKYIPSLDGLQLVDSSALLTETNWLVSSFYLDNENIGSVASDINSSIINFFDCLLTTK